jgi:hypothetical protein
MKRFALVFAAAVAVIVVALPATAGAATFRGVVIAKDSARTALVTASGNGTVRTVRVRTGFKRIAVGRLVAVRAAKLPDGTFSASAVKRLGKTRASEGAGLQPGDRVESDARLKHGGLEAGAGDIDEIGHGGRVFVTVPVGMDVPAFVAGDEIALVVAIEGDGSFTLVKADNENGSDDDGIDAGSGSSRSWAFSARSPAGRLRSRSRSARSRSAARSRTASISRASRPASGSPCPAGMTATSSSSR